MKTYIEWAQAQLDEMSSESKDAIILGLVTALWPGGDTDSPISGADLLDECTRLLGELHPDHNREECETCGECGRQIPEVAGGGLANRHHDETCSLFEAGEE